MEAKKKYVIYELNRVMGSSIHLALQKVEFDGMQWNSFDTEELAIQALIDNKKHYEDYIILLQIYIN